VLWPDVSFYHLCVHKGAGLAKNLENAEYSPFLLEPRCSRFVGLGLILTIFRINHTEACAAYDIGPGLKDLLLIPAQISCVMMGKSLAFRCLSFCIQYHRIIQVGKEP